jgi:hypothetical protein
MVKEELKDNLSVECTWGDGPDILVAGEGKLLLSMKSLNCKGWSDGVGVTDKWQLDLTRDEAYRLIDKLICAINGVDKLECPQGPPLETLDENIFNCF